MKDRSVIINNGKSTDRIYINVDDIKYCGICGWDDFVNDRCGFFNKKLKQESQTSGLAYSIRCDKCYEQTQQQLKEPI